MHRVGDRPAGRRHRRIGAVDAEELWREYWEHGSVAARDELVARHVDLARVVATKLSGTLPPSVELSDLISHGMIGLFDAVTKYDATKNVKFETYAALRIKGAILDELRTIDWVPRSVRQKARALQVAAAKLETSLHRHPTDDELAVEMGVSLADVNDIRNDANWAVLTSSATVTENDGDPAHVQIVDTIADTADAVADTWEFDELAFQLAVAMQSLKGRELEVARMYYLEEVTLAEIGVALGVTESRVCQLHSKATAALRRALSDERPT